MFLFQPFQNYSEKKLLSIGLAFTIVGSLLGFAFKGRFDGVLDLHFTEKVSVVQPLVDNIINISCLALFLFLAGIYINKKTRFIDILITAIVARFPYYLLTFFNINDFMSRTTENLMNQDMTQGIPQIPPSDLLLILVFGFFSLLILVWFIILLYNGFKVASHAKGALPIFLFSIAVLLAEIASKYFIYQFNY